MCGIVGYLSNKKIPLKNNLLKMQHRGPDSTGEYHFNSNAIHGGLGHVRLSIIDLHSHANQPFSYLDRYTIVFNGEIYNFIELKKELKTHNYNFSTSSDTEVLIAAYDYYKEKVFDYLHGMFAFAIYDKVHNKLICARDHLGIKPLYYYFNIKEKKFFFASELKTLFSFSDVPKKISKDSISEFLINGWLYEPDTGFENIFKVMPGAYIEYNLQTSTIKNEIYFDVSNEQRLRDIVKTENIEKLIDNSINIQCRSDVPLGLFFSGGVDSTIIASKVTNPNCLTAKYDKGALKDSGIASDYDYSMKIAEKLNLNISSIELEQEDFSIKKIKSIVRCTEEPIADFTYQISEKISFKAREKGYKVMLSGMGADEIFGGYPRYRFIAYKRLFSFIAIGIKPFKGLIKKFKKFDKKIDRFFLFTKEKNFIDSYSSLIVGFSNKEVGMLVKKQNSLLSYHNKLNQYLEKVKNKSNFKKAFYLDLYGFLSHNFTITDKSSMQASIEVRVPLVNKFLLVKNFYEDENKLLDFKIMKKQLKNILKIILPKNIINRKKTGFNPPMDIIINSLGKATMISIIKEGTLNKYIHLDYIYLLIENHFNQKDNNTYKLWIILYLNYWIEENETNN
jgi:asparagine synthase (glutamine-hydrolysing)